MDQVTYRTNDPSRWGTGQGSDLAAAQIDLNFWALFSMIQAIADHQNVAGVISNIGVQGGNLFVTLGDGTVFGPFTLPTAQWTFRGAWLPTTLYNPMDVITSNGGLYLALVRHTSAATFNPSANDGQGHSFYQLMIGPGPYDVAMFFPDRIPDDSSILLVHVAARSFYLPQNLNLPGVAVSAAALDKYATSELQLPIYKNKAQIGAILFGGPESSGSTGPDVQSDGSEIGTFVFTQAVQFNRGDRLIICAPAPISSGSDPTAQGLTVTLAGIIGLISP
jgi:hypothetical protein